MLVPAITKQDELKNLFAEHMYDEDMFFYNGYPYNNVIPEIVAKENNFLWAIMDKSKVIGFFSYYIDTYSDSVSRFGLYSFDRGNPIIGFDVYKKLKELINKHHRLEWQMIGGNPVQKHYDKFCQRFGGRKVVLHDVVKNAKGQYCDDYIYEIINPNR